MNRHTLYQPLPPRLTQTLIFLNGAVGLVAATLLARGHEAAAAYVALGAGILNQAVNVFVGQNPNPHNEKVPDDSTLSNRRDLVPEKGPRPKARRTKGGAE